MEKGSNISSQRLFLCFFFLVCAQVVGLVLFSFCGLVEKKVRRRAGLVVMVILGYFSEL